MQKKGTKFTELLKNKSKTVAENEAKLTKLYKKTNQKTGEIRNREQNSQNWIRNYQKSGKLTKIEQDS